MGQDGRITAPVKPDGGAEAPWSVDILRSLGGTHSSAAGLHRG